MDIVGLKGVVDRGVQAGAAPAQTRCRDSWGTRATARAKG